MKKFLGKKPVMIAFIIAAVVFLAVEIGILVRPISYGLNYTYKTEVAGVQIKSVVKVHSDSVARATMIEGEEKAVMDQWIYRDGDKVLMLGTKKYIEITGMKEAEIEEMNKSFCMTKAQYEEAVKELKELKKNNKEAYNAELEDAMKFGIFQAGEGDEIAKCPQAIAFVVIHGAVTATLIVFAVLSILARKKKA